jgi:hypothetical protein
MKPLYTSFYTPDYADHAKRLIASFKAHNLPYVVARVPAFSSWQAACLHKPAHLLAMRKHHGRPLVWIDADAVIVRKPELLEALNDDFAAYWHHGEELFSGTLYFGATEQGDKLLRAWRDGCHDTPTVIDQVVLSRVIGSNSDSDLKTYGLPTSYCHVSSIMGGEPVIAHKMASRGR